MKLRPAVRPFVLLAVLAQLFAVAWLASEREWICRTGQVAYLRTAPIDPRDLFRGDFVRLQFEINSVRPEGIDPAVAAAPERKHHEVMYTRLRAAGERLFELAGTGTTRPTEREFLRGRAEDPWHLGWRGRGNTFVKYGVEQLFVRCAAGSGRSRRPLRLPSGAGGLGAGEPTSAGIAGMRHGKGHVRRRDHSGRGRGAQRRVGSV